NESLTSLFNDIHNFEKVKNLLIVDDNQKDLDQIVAGVTGSDIVIHTARTAQEAVQQLTEKSFDCIILDLVLPDAEGLDIINDLENNIAGHETAISVHSARDLNEKQRSRLKRFAHSIIIKSSTSLDELVDRT